MYLDRFRCRALLTLFGNGRVWAALLFVSAVSAVSLGYAQTMLNPLLFGVTNVEVACLFDAEALDIAARDRICDMLVDGASQKIGLPATRNDEARPLPIIPGAIIRAGIFWIEAQVNGTGDGGVTGRLSWGNSRPMSGVAGSQGGVVIVMGSTGSVEENEQEFVDALLETIKF